MVPLVHKESEVWSIPVTE